jgi:hypothetical protein
MPPAARGVGYDNFSCAPVRFECATGDRTDPWAHMQLDALGLFLVAYGTLAQAGHLAPDTGLVRPHSLRRLRNRNPRTRIARSLRSRSLPHAARTRTRTRVQSLTRALRCVRCVCFAAVRR